jgi:hypothetical protein
MGGGILQLSAYGSQDTHLTGNPQITYFKSVYYRYTNFSMESVENTFDTDPGFGRKVTATISRTGDLIHKMYIVVDIPALTDPGGNDHVGWTNKLGHALIKNVDVTIGGEVVDKHNSEWLEIWSSLSNPESKKDALKTLIGEYDGGIIGAQDNNANRVGNPGYEATSRAGETISGESKQKLYIPLQFWFCRSIGSSIPLISLPHQDVKINIEFRNLNELVKSSAASPTITGAVSGATPTFTASLFVDYIYLDTKERQIFTEKSHEYVIEQVQYDGEESLVLNGNTRFSTSLSFTQPVKEIFWVVTNEDRISKTYNGQGNSLLDFSTDQTTTRKTTDEFDSAVIKINGVDRFTPRDALYFRAIQPIQYHTSAPLDKYIYCYSFCLKPEELQPSGSCNFSMLDTATLQLNYTASDSTRSDNDSRLKVFALNYNILRVTSGMCGLAYSN